MENSTFEQRSFRSNDKQLMLINVELMECYYYKSKKISKKKYSELLEMYPEMPPPSQETELMKSVKQDIKKERQKIVPADPDNSLPFMEFESAFDTSSTNPTIKKLRSFGCELFKSKTTETWWIVKFPESYAMKISATKLINAIAIKSGFTKSDYEHNRYAVIKL